MEQTSRIFETASNELLLGEVRRLRELITKNLLHLETYLVSLGNLQLSHSIENSLEEIEFESPLVQFLKSNLEDYKANYNILYLFMSNFVCSLVESLFSSDYKIPKTVFYPILDEMARLVANQVESYGINNGSSQDGYNPNINDVLFKEENLF